MPRLNAVCLVTRCSKSLPAVLLALVAAFSAHSQAQEPHASSHFGPTSLANRLTYLDHPCDPYHVGQHFPKLLTPQWIGEPEVEAVIVLAIDDMRDPAKYEAYLRPIFERLKQIDGRAPVSIMTNAVDPTHPQVAAWMREPGINLDVHTVDHPCPCLQGGDFAKAKSTYDRCVDQMASIKGNHPVAFRMPCCDSLNTPSPRFWSEIFNATTAEGHFLQIDSSVFQIYTAEDPELPADLLVDPDGRPRFNKYLPFPSFVNTIRNYPYPYVIGRLGWQFPCMVPSDWEAQNLHQPNNPVTVADLNAAVDLTVTKQGVMNLVFHPHGWIRAEQIVEMIDHAVATHGNKVKFLSFHEAQERINQNLLAGHALRQADGSDSGTRLLDLNHDGILDVVCSGPNGPTRVWNPTTQTFRDYPTPFRTLPDTTPSNRQGIAAADRARFGVLDRVSNAVEVLATPNDDPNSLKLFRFTEQGWQLSPIAAPWTPRTAAELGSVPHLGLRGSFRDLDGDGVCEWLVDAAAQANAATTTTTTNTALTRVFQLRDQAWHELPVTLPAPWTLFPLDPTATDHGVRFVDVDADGRDDLIASNEIQFGAYRFDSLDSLFHSAWITGDRTAATTIPMISRLGTNNGAWFHSRTLWVQNEETHRLADLVERMPLETLLNHVDPTRRNQGLPLPRTPEVSLQTLRIDPAFEVQLVAAEPLVADPVAFDWGIDGRLWVVEMADYPLGIDAAGTVGGRVRVLTDDNGDGVFDRSTIFLENLPYPNGIKVWQHGVLITTAPDLIWAYDSDSDDRADQVETILTGFEPGNQQHRFNGLRYGIDHRLYLANGDSGGSITAPGLDRTLAISGRDLWFTPAASGVPRAIDFGTTSGQTQFGRDRDDWQHWFGGNNANPMWHYVLDERYLSRNPMVDPISTRRDVSIVPGASQVYPLSPTLARFNELNMANRFTSACSPMVYRDSLLGAELQGNAVICEPVHNLVHREVMSRAGASWTSQRAATEQRSEFLASDDPWFRPVMARTGPDGAIWIADMYRLVIEHPEWIPQDRQDQLELRSGSDRGRIYRVVPRGATPGIPRIDALDLNACVALMESSNGQVRDMAQQRLIWEQATQAAPQLKQLLESSVHPTARLHALMTLSALSRLETSSLGKALIDEHPEVRRWGLRVAETMLVADPSIESATTRELLQVVAARGSIETEPVVLLQLAATLGATSDKVAVAALVELLPVQTDDEWLSAAIASSFRKETIEQIVEQALVEGAVPVPGRRADAVLRSAAGWVEPEVFDRWLTAWLPNDAAASSLPLARTRGWQAIVAWQSHGRPITPVAQRWLAERTDWARTRLDDPSTDPSTNRDRVTALELLGASSAPTAEDAARVVEHLIARRPTDLRAAALEAFGEFQLPEAADAALDRWSELSPETRLRVVELLLARRAWAERLTDAMVEGRVTVRDLGPTAFDRLMREVAPQLGERAASLAMSLPSADREQVVNQYAAALAPARDAARGRELFRQHCANCHRLDAIGAAIGPDLAALSNRSDAFLLAAILDPNRAVEDKYLQYLAETDDGLQLAGVILNESEATVTLGTVDAKEVVLRRERLLGLESTGRSLMPEGLEAQLDASAMSDVLAFLQSNLTPPKTFPGNEPGLVSADGLGVVHLSAKTARIYGPSIVFESTHENVGWWSNALDYVMWEFEIEQAGKYEVELDYASANGASGGRFAIEVGVQKVEGTVIGTGTWDDYQQRVVGTIELDAGKQELSMRAVGPIDSALVDLRAIRLRPRGD